MFEGIPAGAENQIRWWGEISCRKRIAPAERQRCSSATAVTRQVSLRSFGSGTTFTVNGIPRTIVGAVPHEVSDMVAADLWLPTAINPNGNERKNHTYGIVARLKPGVTMEQARAEMVMIAQRLEKQYPATNSVSTPNYSRHFQTPMRRSSCALDRSSPAATATGIADSK